MEDFREHAVERIEVAFMFDQARARQVIEALETRVVKAFLDRLHEREPFLRTHWNAGIAKTVEQLEEHGYLAVALTRCLLTVALTRSLIGCSAGRARTSCSDSFRPAWRSA